MPQPIAVLISGRGSNMRALAEQARTPGAPYSVALVLSDKPTAAGLATARDFGIAARALPAEKGMDRATYDRGLAAVIDDYAPSLIVLAGFMRILSPEFVARYAGRILNIHPSLLPKYPGLHTHRSVLAAREQEHGATVHFVTAELDGGPPVLQARMPVRANDDESTLAARVMVQEHAMYPLVVRWFCEGRLSCRDGHAWLDGRVLSHPLLYDGTDPTRGH
jgi:phosphoribosylglycinamide formyltransferase 1